MNSDWNCSHPYLIRCFGPLRHLWTLRFESKHRFFKNILRHSPNFKNPLMFLATRHQLSEALNFCDTNLYSEIIVADTASIYVDNNYPNTVTTILSRICGSNSIGHVTNSLVYHNIEYKQNTIICTDKDDFGLYHLCKVKYFFIKKCFKSFVIFGERIIVCYDSDSGLYEKRNLNQNNPLICKNFEDVLNLEPILHCNSVEGSDQMDNLFYFQSAPFDV